MSELDKQVAEALGYRCEDSVLHKGNLLIFDDDGVVNTNYSPSTNWEQGGKLLDEYWYQIVTELEDKYGSKWHEKIDYNLLPEFMEALVRGLKNEQP